MLIKPYTNTEKYLGLLHKVRLDEIINMHKEIFDNYKMNSFVIGNIKEAHAQRLVEHIFNMFKGFHSIE